MEKITEKDIEYLEERLHAITRGRRWDLFIHITPRIDYRHITLDVYVKEGPKVIGAFYIDDLLWDLAERIAKKEEENNEKDNT